MDPSEKITQAKLEKSAIKKEISRIRAKQKKWQKELEKKERHLEKIEKIIRKAKQKISGEGSESIHTKRARKKSVKEDPEMNRSLVPEQARSLASIPEKGLRKIREERDMPAKKRPDKQDLTIIYGITSELETRLNEAGIRQYSQLAHCSSETLFKLVKDIDPSLQDADTLTWPEQALLADLERFEELKKLQAKLRDME